MKPPRNRKSGGGESLALVVVHHPLAAAPAGLRVTMPPSLKEITYFLVDLFFWNVAKLIRCMRQSAAGPAVSLWQAAQKTTGHAFLGWSLGIVNIW